MIGLAATAAYLPEMDERRRVAAASGIPEQVIREKFGLRGKHIAAADEHVSDMSVAAATRLLDGEGVDPAEIDVVLYYGSLWKDYPVWQAAPWIAHRLGCENAYAVEYANVSCGTPVALRLARNFLLAGTGPGMCWSSPRAASRTCSTTGTSARASCSTSATAPWPGW